MTLTPGQLLRSRYQIQRILGQGGFGAVYQALDVNLQRQCAIKQSLDTDPHFIRQFDEEARFLVKLGKHPNLVQVFDYFSESNNVRYLVMELVEGETLGSLVQRQGPRPASQAVEWMTQVLDAVEFLHSQNPPVIHRDIKPNNIKLTPQGRAILVDFGIAKQYYPGEITQTGARAVTPGYSPLEQYGKERTDPRSDIYSLGATLYEIITGQVPLESVARAAGEVLPNPRQLNSAISLQVEQVILKAMGISPSKRYQTAREMRQALQATGLSTVPASPAPSMPLPLVLACRVCGNGARPNAKFCSFCSAPLLPPPPQPPIGVAQRPPIFGSLTIPLVCTLAQAKMELFTRTRDQRVLTIVNAMLQPQNTTARTFMLRGIKGFGGTTIAENIRDKIRAMKGANLVGLVILPEKAPSDSWVPVIEEMLRGLKQGAGSVDEKLQKTVEQYHREYISNRRYLHAERGEQAEVELTLPRAKVLGNELDIGAIKRKPMPDTPPPYPADEKQRGQILLHALRDLIEYLVSQNACVVLIIDKVFDLETLQPLRPLTILPNVFIVTIAEKKQHDLWRSNAAQSELIGQFSKVDEFFPCLWEMPRDLCRRLTQGQPAADTPTFERFIKYIQFKGRGLPDLIVRAIAPYCTDAHALKAKGIWQRIFRHSKEEETSVLHIPAEDLPMIFTLAEIEDFLSGHWTDIFRKRDSARIMGNEVVSAAKVSVYTLLDWLVQQSQSGIKPDQASVMACAQSNCGLPIAQKWVVENLVQLLQQDQICSLDANGCLGFSAFYDRRDD